METQKAAYMYERACSMHEAAKEMVQVAEQGYMQREEMTDSAWQEMLNHATMKVKSRFSLNYDFSANHNTIVWVSHLLKSLRSLFDKQYWSSLIWVHAVCFLYFSNLRQLFAAEDFSRQLFQMHFYQHFKGQEFP